MSWKTVPDSLQWEGEHNFFFLIFLRFSITMGFRDIIFRWVSEGVISKDLEQFKVTDDYNGNNKNRKCNATSTDLKQRINKYPHLHYDNNNNIKIYY